MSSSNRAAPTCEAVVFSDDHPTGPVLLPENRPNDFVDHFNRIYAGLGMRIESIADSGADAGEDPVPD